jgi:DNA-binding beta-propeller fold protein YncE/cytochrome oxidase Cu insertion factor (SCO1/SenC/PrrC family)
MNHPGIRRLGSLGATLTVAALAVAAARLLTGGGPGDGERPAGGGILRPVSLAQEPITGGLEGGVEWINVAGPIHLEDLRGKIVLLDFWTYCCINCHHILPDLEYLEKKYPNELVVIGVHSGKFDAEKDTDNIRKKVAEYRIKHPVVNDANQVLWQRFGVNSWPTLVLIDANGRYRGAVSGEGHREQLDRVIGHLVDDHKSRNELNTVPLHFPAEADKPHEGPLLYPGKITADGPSKRLFITDTGHNRIVVTDLEGRHVATIGGGAAGFNDGPFERAQFNRPQGTCLVGDILYVADVENHAIRACDLGAKTVQTVAGTGEQLYLRSGGGKATETGLNSPWALAKAPDANALFIAMAGPHQIWRLDLDTNRVAVWAGTGKEDINDGSLTTAAFAQPSGLAVDGTHLYVADSEGSAIRAINLGKNPKVVTIAGTHDMPLGQSLFAFGDRDGKASNSRLQHCLGVALADGKLYVADTYNNKIKVIDPATREVKTLAGTRQAGALDEPPQFDEPGGLGVAGARLFIADTNNHKIRVLNLNTNKVSTLELSGVEPPKSAPTKPKFPGAMVVEVPAVQVEPGRSFKLDVTLALPEGFKLNPDAPMPLLLETPDAPEALGPESPPTGLKLDPPRDKFEVDVPLARPASEGDSLALTLSVTSYQCREGAAGYCVRKNFVWKVPVTFTEGGSKVVPLTNAGAGKKADEAEKKADGAEKSGRAR